MVEVERHVIAHGEKAAVHLGAGGSRLGTGEYVARPELLGRKLLGEVFGDGQ
ncbi:hypothetical protein D3C78_1841820 [compost metagenome]